MRNNRNTDISNFPEEITEDGLRIYGETSYENQMAVLSHYLHNNHEKVKDDKKQEIILAIREFLSRKQFIQGKIKKGSTKSYIPKDFDILCGGFPCQAFFTCRPSTRFQGRNAWNPLFRNRGHTSQTSTQRAFP